MNKQRGSVVLWIVMIVVVLIVAGVIYLSSRDRNVENTQVSVQSNDQTVSIPFTKGERIGDFTVSMVSPHQGSDANGNPVPAGYVISFIGTTTLSGTFTKSPLFGTNEDDPGTIAAFQVDSADLNKIPHDRNNPNQSPADFFYFINRPKIDSAKGIEYGQKHMIIISDFQLYAIESEGGNSARFVNVVK